MRQQQPQTFVDLCDTDAPESVLCLSRLLSAAVINIAAVQQSVYVWYHIIRPLFLAIILWNRTRKTSLVLYVLHQVHDTSAVHYVFWYVIAAFQWGGDTETLRQLRAVHPRDACPRTFQAQKFAAPLVTHYNMYFIHILSAT